MHSGPDRRLGGHFKKKCDFQLWTWGTYTIPKLRSRSIFLGPKRENSIFFWKMCFLVARSHSLTPKMSKLGEKRSFFCINGRFCPICPQKALLKPPRSCQKQYPVFFDRSFAVTGRTGFEKNRFQCSERPFRRVNRLLKCPATGPLCSALRGGVIRPPPTFFFEVDFSAPNSALVALKKNMTYSRFTRDFTFFLQK